LSQHQRVKLDIARRNQNLVTFEMTRVKNASMKLYLYPEPAGRQNPDIPGYRSWRLSFNGVTNPGPRNRW